MFHHWKIRKLKGDPDYLATCETSIYGDMQGPDLAEVISVISNFAIENGARCSHINWSPTKQFNCH